MKFNFSKLKTFLSKSSRAKSGLFWEPEKLWEKFIWFLIFLAIITFAFNGWVFYRFYFNPPEGQNLPEDTVLKTKSFDKALERIEKKKKKFDDYKSNFTIEDPSIIR